MTRVTKWTQLALVALLALLTLFLREMVKHHHFNSESHEFPSSKKLTDEDFFRASDFMVGRNVYILNRRSVYQKQ